MICELRQAVYSTMPKPLLDELFSQFVAAYTGEVLRASRPVQRLKDEYCQNIASFAVGA